MSLHDLLAHINETAKTTNTLIEGFLRMKIKKLDVWKNRIQIKEELRSENKELYPLAHEHKGFLGADEDFRNVFTGMMESSDVMKAATFEEFVEKYDQIVESVFAVAEEVARSSLKDAGDSDIDKAMELMKKIQKTFVNCFLNDVALKFELRAFDVELVKTATKIVSLRKEHEFLVTIWTMFGNDFDSDQFVSLMSEF